MRSQALSHRLHSSGLPFVGSRSRGLLALRRLLLRPQCQHFLKKTDWQRSELMGTRVFDRTVFKPARFRDVSVSASLPGEAMIDTAGHITTQPGGTQVTLNLTKTNLFITFSPALLVRTPLQLSDTLLSGLFYSFSDVPNFPGTLAIVTEDNNTAGYRARNALERQLLAWFNGMTRGTRLTRPGYNPALDSDPRELLKQLQAQIAPTASGPSIPTTTLFNRSFNFTTAKGITKSLGKGAIEIPGGSKFTLAVSFNGAVADIHAGAVRTGPVRLTTSSLFVTYQGDRAAQVLDFSVYSGCSVKLNRYAILSDKLGPQEHASSHTTSARQLFAIVVAIASTGASTDEAHLAAAAEKVGFSQTDIEFAQGIVQCRLTEAIQQVYVENAATLQAEVPAGVDLDTIFGVDCRDTR